MLTKDSETYDRDQRGGGGGGERDLRNRVNLTRVVINEVAPDTSLRARSRSITPLGRLINTPIIRGLCVIIYTYNVGTLRVDPDNPRPALKERQGSE